ncbi:Polysialic acid transport ATP-binding protein KpsT [compost metagenome]
MSVGDAHFREKAIQAFRDRVGRANIILVTHGMSQVRKMCDLILLIKDGQVLQYENIEEGIAAYQAG